MKKGNSRKEGLKHLSIIILWVLWKSKKVEKMGLKIKMNGIIWGDMIYFLKRLW